MEVYTFKRSKRKKDTILIEAHDNIAAVKLCMATRNVVDPNMIAVDKVEVHESMVPHIEKKIWTL